MQKRWSWEQGPYPHSSFFLFTSLPQTQVSREAQVKPDCDEHWVSRDGLGVPLPASATTAAPGICRPGGLGGSPVPHLSQLNRGERASQGPLTRVSGLPGSAPTTGGPQAVPLSSPGLEPPQRLHQKSSSKPQLPPLKGHPAQPRECSRAGCKHHVASCKHPRGLSLPRGPQMEIVTPASWVKGHNAGPGHRQAGWSQILTGMSAARALTL